MHSEISAIAHSKRQQKLILMEVNCIEQDTSEDGPTPVYLYRLVAHYDGDGWIYRQMTGQSLDMNM